MKLMLVDGDGKKGGWEEPGHGSECCQLGQAKTVFLRETPEVDKCHVISELLLQVLVPAIHY